MHYPKWKLDCSILEMILKKLKTLGDYCIMKYGRNFKGPREPIMVLLMANEYEIGNLEDFLISNRYFNYSGIICLSQCIMPNIDSKGKIIMKSFGEISFSSNGSGGFIANLKKAKIFNSWENGGIKFLNIFDITNLNAKIADPISLGFFIKRGYDCIIDCYRNKENKTLKNPCYVEDQEGFLDMCYPFELRMLLKGDEYLDITEIESLHLNMFTSVSFLSDKVTKNAAKVFQYRIKEKLNIDKFVPRKVERLSLSSIEWLPKVFCFELNIANLIKLTPRVCLIEREREDLVMFETKNKGFKEEVMISVFKDVLNDFMINMLKVDPSK